MSDTTYEGYRDIPVDVMHGYGVMAREITRQYDGDQPPTHVFVQAGVGALAASVCASFWLDWGERRPALVVVEPSHADCFFQSALAGRPVAVEGELETVMAGLACGEVSPLAWEIVTTGASAFVVIEDRFALDGVRAFADPAPGDAAIVSGETGAAGLAALLAVLPDAGGARRAGAGRGVPGAAARQRGRHRPRDLPAHRRSDRRAGERVTLGALRVDRARLMARLERLAEIGPIEGGGSCRLALTEQDRLGRDLVVGWMRELGLAVSVDPIGNVFGVRRGTQDGAPVMTGSHIDTVRTGGRYDGNLGVLAGLEVVATLEQAGITTRRPLAVAFFTNEEGARFAPDMLGSLVYAGGLALDEALDTVSIDGRRLGDELRAIGYAGDAALGQPRPHAFVELHIEQGPVLDAEGVTIGAVEDLQGISWQEITITGQSNHAGTTPMRLRHDAGYCAAAIADVPEDAGARDGRRPGLHGRQDRPPPEPDQRDRGARDADRGSSQHRRNAAARRGGSPGGVPRAARARRGRRDRHAPPRALRTRPVRSAAWSRSSSASRTGWATPAAA